MKYAVIILLSVLGAGVLVLVAFAMIRHLSTRHGLVDSTQTHELTTEQLNYMRQFRQRNLDSLAEIAAQDYVRRHDRY